MNKEVLNIEDWLCSAEGGAVDNIQKYLGLGWDINAKNTDGITALCISAFHNHIKIIELLLENGANVNIAAYNNTSNFTSALNIAASFGNIEIMKMLIDAGAHFKRDLTKLGNYDSIMNTPMGQAAYFLKQDGVRLLIDYGCRFEQNQLDILFHYSSPQNVVDKEMNDFIVNYQNIVDERKMISNSIEVSSRNKITIKV